MIVVDASVVVDLLLDTPPFAADIGERLLEHDGDVHAPHLLDAEVGQVIRRYTLRNEMDPARADRALERLEVLPLTRYPHAPFLRPALRLRENLTVYDALYLVLAEALGAPLLTKDAALAAAPGHRARVILPSKSTG